MGEYEPSDSRDVTGAGNQQQQNAAGIQGGQAAGGQELGHGQDGPAADGTTGQQQQFQGDPSQMNGGGTSGGTGAGGDLREHMEVIGADGVHLGTIDAIEGDRIKLTKADSGMGSHQGHHHYLPLALVAEVEDNRVRLSATAANAYGMEQEEGEE